MGGEAHLWLIRHAPVDGPHGVIHDSDAPADTSDLASLARLRAQLPRTKLVICSPARRACETASALGLAPTKEPAFREQNFGIWTGRRHAELAEQFGATYREFWFSPASNRPPGGESFVEQITRVAAGLAALPSGDVILV